MYLTEHEGSYKALQTVPPSQDTPGQLVTRTVQGQSVLVHQDKDGAQSCTPLPCKGAAAPGVSKGFGFIFIQNGRCSSEMGVESPHGAF